MRTVALHVYDYSLDGIFGEEETDFYKFCRSVPEDPEQEAWTFRCLERAEQHIIGRVTYEGMARYFPTATGHPFAGIMNQAPKAVFSSTLKTTGWANSAILSGGITEEIDKLKRAGSGEILAHGGASFARSLVRLGLVDEYRLTVSPYLAGSGTSLFADAARPGQLELVSSQAFANGTLGLTYRRPS
jgi:dihydrofolate reductase